MQHEDALQILDLVESGVIMLDCEQKLVFWNRFVSDTSLIPFETVKDKHWLKVFPDLSNSRIQKAIDKAVNFNFPSILSYKLLKTQFPLYKKSLATKPPYVIVQSIIVKPLMEKNSNKGCIIYINDVSAASNREKELNQQSIELQNTILRYQNVKSQLEQIFDRTHNGIIVFDIQGNVVNVNQAAILLFERDRSQLINTDIAQLIPKLKTLYYDEDRKAYQYLSGINHEFDQEITFSSQKYLSVSVSQIGENQEDGDFFVFISDITERKLAEKKLRSVNVELEEFAYRTSHDLRSPIVSSLGLAKVAKRCIDEGNHGKAVQCLSHMEKSLSKLEVLIQDILQLTEMENAEEPEQLVDIRSIVNQAYEGVCQLEGFERIDRQLLLEEAGSIRVKLSRFRMILENLISNAIKYQDPNTPQPYIKIETQLSDSHFLLNISDNGLGIPKDQQHKLFEMFNRFHPKVAFGSGLGLYLIKKSAFVLGGDIKYLDQGKGACFQLSIPKSQALP